MGPQSYALGCPLGMYGPTVQPGRISFPADHTVWQQDPGPGNTILDDRRRSDPTCPPTRGERRVPEIRMSLEPRGDSVVVSVVGELDVVSKQQFDDCLSEAATQSDRVVLDMS